MENQLYNSIYKFIIVTPLACKYIFGKLVINKNSDIRLEGIIKQILNAKPDLG